MSDTTTVPGCEPKDERASEVLARLDLVLDPELDEPVTSLGFITGITIREKGRVDIGFRLPTYWCAANFAFLMADDMRREVSALPWVSQVGITLGDHMYAETITTAMQDGRGFEEAFGAEADGNLDDVRRTFEVKAFQRRQMALIDHLMQDGFDANALSAMTITTLHDLAAIPDHRLLITRYLQRRSIGGDAGPDSKAFVTVDGTAVTPETFPAHRHQLRRVAVNVEFNGALCRGLLAARFDEQPSEPSLLDFIHGRVPPRPQSTAPTAS